MTETTLIENTLSELGLDRAGPAITDDDGFTTQVDQCGGFTLYSPNGRPFAWAQTLLEADAKVARARRGLIL
jgi:hypothetical protein